MIVPTAILFHVVPEPMTGTQYAIEAAKAGILSH